MQAVLSLIFLAVILLAGCASRVPDIQSRLDVAEPCCASLDALDFATFPEGRTLEVDVLRDPRVRIFQKKKSFFSSYALPPTEGVRVLDVRSWINGELLPYAHIFYPYLLFLDESKKPTRILIPDFEWDESYWAGGYLSGKAAVYPEEKYLVVYTDTGLSGKSIPYSTYSSGMAVVPVDGATLFVPSGPNIGRVDIPLAPAGKVSLKFETLEPGAIEKAQYSGLSIPRIDSSRIHSPEEVEGIRLASVSDYDEYEAGAQLHYEDPQTPGLVADVFVYPVVAGGNVSLEHALGDQVDGVLAELDQAVEQKYLQAVELEELGMREDAAGRYLRARMRMHDQAGTLDSLAFVSMRRGYFVKLRVSARLQEREKFAARADAFARAVMTQITVDQPNLGKLDVRVYFTRGTLAAAQEDRNAFGAWLAHAVQLRERLLAHQFLLDLDDVVTARRAMVSKWRELSDTRPLEAGKQPSVYMQELERVEKAGFMREYVWSFGRPRYWSEPADLRLPEFERWRAVALAGHRYDAKGDVLIR